MITSRAALIGVGAGAALMLVACGLIFPSDTLRQKIIVEVQTPFGVKIGSSVVETRVETGKSWGDASGTRFYLKGEAVVVHLPDGKTLFALLRGVHNEDAPGYQARLIMDALHAGAKSNPTINIQDQDLMQVRAAALSAKLRLDIPKAQYPQLAFFRDRRKLVSIERVDPENMAASFGRGVEIKRISLEITSESVTDNISKEIPWVNIKPEDSLDNSFTRSTSTPTFAQLIRRNDFRRGLPQ